MIIKIRSIEIRTHDPYEDKIHSYTIMGELNNGRLIKIRDMIPFNLQDYIDKKVDCLISAAFISNINAIDESDEEDNSSPVIRGEYLGEYDIPEKWNQCKGFITIKGKHAVDYERNIFLISERDFRRQGIEVNIGEEIIFKAAGLEIKAWLPIE